MSDRVTGDPLERLRLPAAPAAAVPGNERFAASLRGFGPLGLLAILIIVADRDRYNGTQAELTAVWPFRST